MRVWASVGCMRVWASLWCMTDVHESAGFHGVHDFGCSVGFVNERLNDAQVAELEFDVHFVLVVFLRGIVFGFGEDGIKHLYGSSELFPEISMHATRVAVRASVLALEELKLDQLFKNGTSTTPSSAFDDAFDVGPP